MQRVQRLPLLLELPPLFRGQLLRSHGVGAVVVQLPQLPASKDTGEKRQNSRQSTEKTEKELRENLLKNAKERLLSES